MDLVCIDDEYYDPYMILGVVNDDTDEHIAKAFKRRAKKYHPDKAQKNNIEEIKKYEHRFKLILKSYEYIKNKRGNLIIKSKNSNSNQDEIKTTFNEKELKNFNKNFQKATGVSPNEFGYGDYKRMETIDDYKDFKINIINQFKNKKFSIDKFNKIFDYLQSLEEEENNEKSLVHKTTDGFYGYNTSNMNNCAMVSTYNGLLITGDNLGESGRGYWDTNYGDYKLTYKKPQNPDKIINVPSEYSNSKNENLKKRDYKKYISEYKNTNFKKQDVSFGDEEKIIYKKSLEQLIEKEEEDKNIVLKYIHQYDNNTIQQAMNGHLDKSPNLIEMLKEHYTCKRISY